MLNGPEFDRAYMKTMVRDHTEDVAEFKKESTSGEDDDLKSFASQTLPTLEDHLKQAKSIAPKEDKQAMSEKPPAGKTPAIAYLFSLAEASRFGHFGQQPPTQTFF